jgi:hypothetical protein
MNPARSSPSSHPEETAVARLWARRSTVSPGWRLAGAADPDLLAA